jgi:hypothetical protein
MRKKLEALSGQNNTQATDEAKKLRNRMDELLYREEMMWLQRSRISWLKEGDRNTKFFHHKAAARAKKNRIKRLRDDDNWITQNKKEMEGLTISFFKKLYTADSTVQPESVVQLFQPVITEEMNASMCREFSEEEISNALFQIGPLKAPGPNGLLARFFQKN